MGHNAGHLNGFTMVHTALLVKGDFHQIYKGIKEHHNRHHLQGSRMFETDCDCRLRLQYLEDEACERIIQNGFHKSTTTLQFFIDSTHHNIYMYLYS